MDNSINASGGVLNADFALISWAIDPFSGLNIGTMQDDTHLQPENEGNPYIIPQDSTEMGVV